MSPEMMHDPPEIDPREHAIESRHWGACSCHLVRHEGRYYAWMAAAAAVPWCTRWPARRPPASAAAVAAVPARVILSRCRSPCCGVHGQIADGVRGVRAVRGTVGFARTATDGPRQRRVPA